MKLWRREIPLDEMVEAFTVGSDPRLDLHLVKYDCQASMAHARMLARVGLLTAEEAERLVAGLEEIVRRHERGEFVISPEEEDGQTAIENALIGQVGDLGKKIHTARSRNDQVLAALRLYYKAELETCRDLVREFQQAVAGFVTRFGGVAWPGYTHTRKAMPSSMASWGNAFADAMADNLLLLDAARNLVDQSPLGTAAGYGVPVRIDPAFTADALGFARVQANGIYAQMSRGKFEGTILHALSQIMHDLNRAATDLILFSMPELGYFELPPQFCTGSSIMPQKKNPDVLEILRAKYHVVVSCEMQVKNLTASLMSGYNRDVQLTKQPVMEGFEITEASLAIASHLFRHLRVDEKACQAGMTAELFATEEVYRLVRQGVPFRDAYRRVAEKYS